MKCNKRIYRFGARSLSDLAAQSSDQISRTQAVDVLELAMRRANEEGNTIDCPLVHTFTPGMVSRQITMPAGSLIISKIHKTEHQFIISKGVVSVNTDDGEWKELQAPYLGVTKPGTRRVLYIHEETVWTTLHPGDDKTPEELEERIIEKHTPQLPAGHTGLLK